MLFRRMFLLLLFLVVVSTFLYYITISSFINPRFISIENENIMNNLKRVVDAINRELFHLNTLSNDWAFWNDTYEYVEANNSDYEKSNLLDETFFDSKIDYICIMDLQGKKIWEKALDYQRKISFELEMKIPDTFLSSKELNNNKSLSGIIETSQGLMLLSISQILRSNKQGPSRGYFIMGKLADSHIIKLLREQTNTSFTINKTLRSDDEIFLNFKNNNYLYSTEDNTIIASHILDAIDGTRYEISLSEERILTKQGRKLVTYTWISLGGIGVAILVFFALMFHVWVLKPLLKLKEHTDQISKTAIINNRLYPYRKDEIGALSNQIEEAFANLFITRNKLMDISFQSGMREMAATYLHNLRNSITPLFLKLINIRMLSQSRNTERVDATFESLKKFEMSDEAHDYLEYLELVFRELMKLLGRINKNIDIIDSARTDFENELLKMQKFIRLENTNEMIPVSEIITDIDKIFNNKNIKLETNMIEGYDIEKLFIKTDRILFKYIYNQLVRFVMNYLQARDISLEFKLEENDTSHLFIINLEFLPAVEIDKIKNIFNRNNFQLYFDFGVDLHWCANTLKNFAGQIEAGDLTNSRQYIKILLALK
ncbi:MAG: CHASE4 domain-containing protein [Candidatus Cloacimonetes bacterium]|nr:CHASE4 domain-containing protein [Candidatus Cloacimonadota bacterium]